MRLVAISILALITLCGCVSLNANVPEDVVRRHMAKEEGLELASICSHAGQTYSEGAVACMADRRMTCDPEGRWVQDGDC
ncbi:MAG: hypothetical protein QNK05_09625 [Myxococcota bacterium]|nr:hypothetical protein [Myxococcota bacterium]